MDMDEKDFVSMHKGVLDAAISKGVFKEIIGKLKLSSFARKKVQEEDPEDFNEEAVSGSVPEPSTSQDFSPTQPKVRKKSIAKGRGRGKTSAKKSAENVIVSPAGTLQKVDTMTQTDSDFEEYLQLSEEQFEEYQLYKEMKMIQQYSVQTIQEEDFRDYDGQ